MAKRLTEELGLKSDYLDLFHFLAIVTDCEGRIIFAAGSEYGNCGLWVKAAFEVFYQDGARFNPGYVGHEETVFD